MKHQFKYPNVAHSGQKGAGCKNTYTVFLGVEIFSTVSFADLYGNRRDWVSFN